MNSAQYIKAVAEFAVEYINNVEARTNERNSLIRDAAQSVLNRQISTCESCLIEVVMQIYNLSKMEETQYKINAGALLEISSRADLCMTLHNTTTDLAELHLGLKPHEIKYFYEYPVDENGEFIGVTPSRLAELKEKFEVSLVYPTEVTTSFDPVDPVDEVEEVEEGSSETFENTGKKRGRPSKQ